MYDIIIVGAGPAGSTLARLLKKDYNILLLEKRNFSDNSSDIHKCCGGLLAPDAQLMLAKFGLGIPKSVLLSPQLFAVRVIDLDNTIERYYQRHYINVDRGKFDKWLMDMIDSDVQIVNESIYKTHQEKEDHVIVTFHKKGKTYEKTAKLLIGADGAFSQVRRQSFNSHSQPDLYIAIQEWFKDHNDKKYFGAIFDKEITDFYSWTIPKGNYLIVGGALKPHKNVDKKFQKLKTKLGTYGYNLEESIKKSGGYLYRPVKSKQICLGNKRVALVGEAAGFISPSSAEGISYAFRSSLALSKALRKGIDDYQKAYQNNLKSLMLNITRKNLKCPAMYNKYLRKLVMKSGIITVKPESV